MKIIHFSDIHVGGWVKSFSAYFDKRLIGASNYILRRKKHLHWSCFDEALVIIKNEQPDIVIFTGDLTSISEVAEFNTGIERMKPLVENTSFELLCVPGNHDRYINSPKLYKKLNETYNYLNRGKFDLADFPHRTIINGIEFYLVDESRPNTLSNSGGYISEQSITTIKQWCKEKEGPAILIGHYPLLKDTGKPLEERRALENGNQLLHLLKTKELDITMCGHIHHAFIREEESGSLEICAGSLTIGRKMSQLVYHESTKKFEHNWINT